MIAIDALAARSSERLGKTIQLSDSGISPGSGVLNRRAELSQKSLGVPVLSIGIPTVVDASTLVYDLCPNCSIADDKIAMMVTPRDIDALAARGAKIISRAVNRALQPQLTDEEIEELSVKCTYYGKRKIGGAIKMGKEEIAEVYRMANN